MISLKEGIHLQELLLFQSLSETDSLFSLAPQSFMNDKEGSLEKQPFLALVPFDFC